MKLYYSEKIYNNEPAAESCVTVFEGQMATNIHATTLNSESGEMLSSVDFENYNGCPLDQRSPGDELSVINEITIFYA